MKRAMKLDPVTLAVMNNRLAAIAEEMGVVLGQTGFSPNIKERHDFSCALFDGGGELVAQAAHIPVHLGSTPLSVRAAIERLELGPGDVAAVNDPFAGGTHLPDLTLVAADLPRQRAPPVRVRRQPRPSRGYRRDGAGLDGALDRDLPGGLSPAAGPAHARGRSRRATCWSCSSPIRACARSARATCARKSRRSTSAPSGCAGWWRRAGARR